MAAYPQDFTLIGRTAAGPMPRKEAAAVLALVADLGATGNFPDKVTYEQIGRALCRLVPNSHQLSDPLVDIISGWRLAERGE